EDMTHFCQKIRHTNARRNDTAMPEDMTQVYEQPLRNYSVNFEARYFKFHEAFGAATTRVDKYTRLLHYTIFQAVQAEHILTKSVQPTCSTQPPWQSPSKV